MLNQIRPALVLIVLMTLLTGLLYPLGLTAIAHILFPRQAAGSLIERDGKVIGSNLIGQSFAADKYFHSRPSATAPGPYNAAGSGGSNLGPTSRDLVNRIKTESEKQHAENPMPVPADLVTSSASGLDPHITPAAAQFQIARVARVRNLPETDVAALVTKFIEPRLFGFIGEPTVNVLELNLALDDLAKSKTP